MSENGGNKLIPSNVVGRPYLFERTDRRNRPWGARFKMQSGKYVTRFFEDESARAEFVREFRVGTQLESFSAVEWERWSLIKGECDRLGVRPETLLAHYVASGAEKRLKSGKLEKLAKDYVASRENTTAEYRDHLKSFLLNKFVPTFGGKTDIGSLTKDRLQAWLNKSATNVYTLRNYRGYIRALLIWAHENGYLLAVPKLTVPPTPTGKIGILSVDEAERLFVANIDNAERCAMLALGAFAGIRASNIARLKIDQMRISDRQIYIPAEQFKTRRSHLIEHAPDNLWAWLERANLKKMCGWSLSMYQASLRTAYDRAQIDNPKNALRHSFATYKCAIDGSAERASYILGHTNPAEIWQSYKGIATKADAERYFAIVPTKAMNP